MNETNAADMQPDMTGDMAEEMPAAPSPPGRFWDASRQMYPVLPTRDEAWSARASHLIQQATRLGSCLPPVTRGFLAELLRLVNGYYTNLIESHHTFPVEVEAAVRRAAAGTGPGRDLVAEAMSHLEVQTLLAQREDDPADPALLAWIHREFIGRLPPTMRWTETAAGTTRVPVIPGAWRNRPVVVGRHEPPAWEALPLFLGEFQTAYGQTGRPSRGPTPEAIARIAAAHQRFAWIHPFVDGNGRVGRLMTDAMFDRAGLSAGGLWRISRGFARRDRDYKAALAAADGPRAGDLDGRGNLTQVGLDRWCDFVVDIATDQVEFMLGCLATDRLPQRVIAWATATFPRSQSAVPIGLLVERAIRYGSVDRATAVAVLGVTERHARRVFDDLIAAQVIAIDTGGTITPRFPVRAVPYWFPGLFPADEEAAIRAAPPAPLQADGGP